MILYLTHIHKAIDEIPIFQGYEGIKVILDQLNIFDFDGCNVQLEGMPINPQKLNKKNCTLDQRGFCMP